MASFLWHRKGGGSSKVGKNRRVSIQNQHAVSSAGQVGTILRVYLLDDTVRAVRITSETNCQNVILELKKQLHLENDAFYSLYNASGNSHAEGYKINDEEIISDIVSSSEFQENKRHILFRRRIYLPSSILTEEELSAQVYTEGAHMLAWREAIEFSETLLVDFETDEKLLTLAALRMQDEFYDFDEEDKETHKQYLMKNLSKFAKTALPIENAVKATISYWKDFKGMSKLATQQHFIELCKDSSLYGAAVFDAECGSKTLETSGPPSTMAHVKRVAVGYPGIFLLGQKPEDRTADKPLCILQSMAQIGKWTISPKSSIFAFDDEAGKFLYYVKLKNNLMTNELFTLVDDYMSVLHSKQVGQVTNARLDTLNDMNLPAPLVRRGSIVRIREETRDHMENAPTEVAEENLPNGWEKHWSEEYSRYYFYHMENNFTTWNKSEVLAESAELTAVPVMASQTHNYHLWSEAFFSIGFNDEKATVYASILAAAGLGHEDISKMDANTLVGLRITNQGDINKIVNLSALAMELDENIGLLKKNDEPQMDEWEKHQDPMSGKFYFWNKATNTTSWTLPSDTGETKSKAGKHRHLVIANESVDDQAFEKHVYEKSAESAALIQDALKQNFVFENLEEKDRSDLTESFFLRHVSAGTNVINQGDTGDFFYVVDSGSFDIFVDKQKVVEITTGGSFGELSLLYNCPRAATVTASVDGKLWAIDRNAFKHIIKDASEAAYNSAKEALKDVHILKALKEIQFDAVASAVKTTKFKAGDYIIRKGEQGEIFYMIKEGEVMCVIPPDPSKNRRKSKPIKLIKGQYFGERALQRGEPRAADVVCLSDTCTCMTLDRQAFQTLLGPLQELLANNVAVVYLESIPSFATKEQGELYEIAESVEERIFPAGSVIQDEGSPITHLYVIREGDCVIYRGDSHVSNLCAGQYFNEVPQAKSRLSILAFNEVSVMCVPLAAISAASIRAANRASVVKAEGMPGQENQETRVLNANNIMLSELTEIKTLGQGSFGRVVLVRREGPGDGIEGSGSIWALKKMSKTVIDDQKQTRNVMNEKNILAMLDHPFVLRLEATFQDQDVLYMLFEIVPGGELFNHLDRQPGGTVSPEAAKFYIACMISAFKHIHSLQVIYRDIKSENAMIDREGYLKLIDFGFAKIIENRTHTLLGTPEYFAPELLKGKGYGLPIDNWGLGILLYEMLVGTTPFADDNTARTCEKILRNEVMIPQVITDLNCRGLISMLLTKDPVKRIGSGTKRTSEIMAHSWLRSIDWNALERKEVEAPWVPELKTDDHTDTVDQEAYWEETYVPIAYDRDQEWCKDF